MDLSQCFLLTFYHSLKTSLKSTKPPAPRKWKASHWSWKRGERMTAFYYLITLYLKCVLIKNKWTTKPTAAARSNNLFLFFPLRNLLRMRSFMLHPTFSLLELSPWESRQFHTPTRWLHRGTTEGAECFSGLAQNSSCNLDKNVYEINVYDQLFQNFQLNLLRAGLQVELCKGSPSNS